MQQDAQEFNKLLLSFLEEQLKLSADPSLSTLVPSQFQGQYRYLTICSGCNQPSASSATNWPFYELTLNVIAQRTQKAPASLHDALREYVESTSRESSAPWGARASSAMRRAASSW